MADTGAGVGGGFPGLIPNVTLPLKFAHPLGDVGLDMTWVIHPATLYACALCVVFAIGVSVRAIYEHVTRYDYPRLQIQVVRILLMIPFYGVLTFASLYYHRLHFFLDTIRDTYESFVLYTFFMLLVQYCGGEAQLIRSLEAKEYKGVHPVPLQWLPYFRLNRGFYLRCKRWVLQYALLKPVVTLLACVGSIFGFYEEASFDPYGLYLYCMISTNISISYSLYYLVLFHLETEKELHYCKPGWKFICIKSIIFFAFWQGVTVAVLISMGLIYTGEGEVREQVNVAIQNVLMCFELAPVSLMHHTGFGRDKLEDEMSEEPQYCADEGGIYASRQHQRSAKTNLEMVFDLSDFVTDTIRTIFYRSDTLMSREDEEDHDANTGRGGGGGAVEMAARAASYANVQSVMMSKRQQQQQQEGTLTPTASAAFGSGMGQQPLSAGIQMTADDLKFLAAMQDGSLDPSGAGFGFDDGIAGGGVGGTRSTTLAGTSAAEGPYAVEVSGDGDDQQYVPEEDDGTQWLNPKGFRSKSGNGAGLAISANDALVEDYLDVEKPAVFCTVCGRYDRTLVKRKSGYKCVECVGSASRSQLRRAQEEVHAEDNDDSCVVCGRKDRVMVKKGQKMRCIQCLDQKH